ncbi:E3 ubiquitin-protein ligase ATL4-like [Bidens hawaiensis]|uniref:E3 ubiquitin-protein ligase ATL4-like n=1 Tax=Bidens hawaiensis TaxID=980011 RepID=UPI00404B879A
MILTSVTLVLAFIYFLIRFFKLQTASIDIVSGYPNEEHMHNHMVSIPNNNEQQLDWLPVFTFSSITVNNNNEQQLDCAVCLSIFEDKDRLRRLPCFHAFHVECIDAWVKCNLTCPLCRSAISRSAEADIMNETVENISRSNSLRIEIGSINPRRDLSELNRSYSLGSVEYVVDELAVEIGGGSRNWLREYLERGSVSRRSKIVDECEATHVGVGVERSEYFRWVSGV